MLVHHALTSEVTGCFITREVKGFCDSCSCNFGNAMHGIHESQFHFLAVVVRIL